MSGIGWWDGGIEMELWRGGLGYFLFSRLLVFMYRGSVQAKPLRFSILFFQYCYFLTLLLSIKKREKTKRTNGNCGGCHTNYVDCSLSKDNPLTSQSLLESKP